MKKTDRKNKTNQTVTYPSCIFTIKELNELNPDIVTISLRDKVKKAIKRGELNVIGVLPNGKGRPTLVHVFGSITKSIIDEAKSKGVHLNRELLVEMVNINSSAKESVVVVDVDTTKTNSVNV
jgi:hypothetical protein